MRCRRLGSNEHPCPYIPGLQALFEQYLAFDVQPVERDALLAAGYRAFGKYLFRPLCRGCKRCVPIRIPVQDFSPNKSMRRVLRRCSHVRLTVGEPQYTSEKFELYLGHKQRFESDEETTEESFLFSFYDPEMPTVEFCYYVEERLAAVGIVHATPSALSSVYFMYHPDFSDLSLGTFSVMKEIEHALASGRQHLYLGYFIRDNRHMRYKSNFYPSEVLTGVEGWTPFRGAKGEYITDDGVTFTPFPIFNNPIYD